jgi:hypothetical protein
MRPPLGSQPEASRVRGRCGLGLAAIGTEINKKGNASRFDKPVPGKFALRAG